MQTLPACDVTGSGMDPVPPDAHLLRPVMDRAAREPDRVVAAYREGDRYVDVTAGEFYGRCRSLAKGLVASGLDRAGRVALMSRTRLEWVLLDYAILAAGGVTVPIYETSSEDQMEWILRDSGASFLVVESPAMRQAYERVAPTLTACREVFVIADGGLQELAARGEELPDAVLDERIASIAVHDLATIVYTSGTTGRPKGCALTHGNLRTNVWQAIDALRPMLQPVEVSLQFLPLAHILAKIITLVGVEWGVKGAFCSDVALLTEEMAMVRPTMVVSVPRIFEKVFNSAQQKAATEGHRAVFDKAADVAIRWSRAQFGGGLHLFTAAEHAVFDRIVYRKIHEVFGGRLRFAFSGGGPLGERLTHFFNGVGVKIFEGYGLTETSPVLTVNTAYAWKPGTVGMPVTGTAIHIGDDGEILAKGPQVFGGYWHDEAATAEVFDADGWFRTGDVGIVDDEGYVRITGRKKELIVTSGGKNVAPAPLEDRIRAHPLVSQAIVLGDNRPFIAAMIALDEECLAGWAAARGLGAVTLTQMLDDALLRSTIQEVVDEANRQVSRAESIRKFAILPRDLTVAAGELTPTLKVRRAIVEKAFEAIVDDLYGH